MGFLEEPLAPLVSILRRKEQVLPGLVTIEATATVREAVDRMRTYDISQLPVFDRGRLVGSVREDELLEKLLADPSLNDAPVAKVMAEPFPLVDPGAELEQVYKLLQRGNSAVLVGTPEKVEGIVTRIDVIEYLAERAQR